MVVYVYSFRIEDLQSADVAMKAEEAEEDEKREEEAMMDFVQSLQENGKKHFALNQQMSEY